MLIIMYSYLRFGFTPVISDVYITLRGSLSCLKNHPLKINYSTSYNIYQDKQDPFSLLP